MHNATAKLRTRIDANEDKYIQKRQSLRLTNTWFFAAPSSKKVWQYVKQECERRRRELEKIGDFASLSYQKCPKIMVFNISFEFITQSEFFQYNF